MFLFRAYLWRWSALDLSSGSSPQVCLHRAQAVSAAQAQCLPKHTKSWSAKDTPGISVKGSVAVRQGTGTS